MSNSQNQNGKLFDGVLLKRVLQIALPFKILFASTALLAVIIAILGAIRPYLTQQTIDLYVLTGDMKGITRMSFILIGILIIESLCQYRFIYSSNLLGQSVIKLLRVRVFERLLQYRLRWFDVTPIGTATTRAISDVEAINDIFSEGLISIVADLLTIFTVLTLMFYSDWRLTLVALIPFPFMVYATYQFKEGIKSTFQIVRNQVARLNAFLQEHISGMNIVQIFAVEEQELKKFEAINDEHTKAHLESIWYYSIFFPVVEVLIAIGQGLLVWFGANWVIGHQTSIGMLVAFIMYLNMLFRPARTLADKFNTLQMGLVASERVFALLDNDETIPNNGKHKDKIKGDISFNDVVFSYNDKDIILSDVSFDIAAGKTLALVGATGAGKSSVINILNRFYDIKDGNVLIDNINIKDYELSSLRKQIGLVLQDVFLFSGSIYENIVLRNYDITLEQVIVAAKMVGAHDFIERLPNTYNYQVMERGATLSLGQRQLISFIRALVYNPSILILDEATSSIDTETEQMIQQAVEKLVANRTAIIIAHRLSTIQHADHIVVLDKGKVVEQGTHQYLLNKKGYYYKLNEENKKNKVVH